MNPVRKVGFVVNKTIPLAAEVAQQTEVLLHERGVVICYAEDGHEGADWSKQDQLNLIFSFGGDGTILRAARSAAPLQVPIFGVNMGRVGFLTEVNPDELPDKLPHVLDGRYWVEQRAMLHCELWRDGREIHWFRALNDVVASRAALSRVVDCTLMVNGHKVTTYVADGVIVATPTGSTAYSMAAGGPILHPELHNIVVTPIAPYLTLLRSLILPGDNQIELDITTDDEAFLTVDGQAHVRLEDGDVLRISLSPDACLFARVQPRSYFAATLTSRLRRSE
nr:ATP-NAD kinase [uncultured bacterium]